MPNMTRRGFIAASAAASTVRFIPAGAGAIGHARRGKWIVKMVYDKSLGMMRVVERFVP